jgi:hypothetical protein
MLKNEDEEKNLGKRGKLAQIIFEDDDSEVGEEVMKKLEEFEAEELDLTVDITRNKFKLLPPTEEELKEQQKKKLLERVRRVAAQIKKEKEIGHSKKGQTNKERIGSPALREINDQVAQMEKYKKMIGNIVPFEKKEEIKLPKFTKEKKQILNSKLLYYLGQLEKPEYGKVKEKESLVNNSDFDYAKSRLEKELQNNSKFSNRSLDLEKVLKFVDKLHEERIKKIKKYSERKGFMAKLSTSATSTNQNSKTPKQLKDLLVMQSSRSYSSQGRITRYKQEIKFTPRIPLPKSPSPTLTPTLPQLTSSSANPPPSEILSPPQKHHFRRKYNTHDGPYKDSASVSWESPYKAGKLSKDTPLEQIININAYQHYLDKKFYSVDQTRKHNLKRKALLQYQQILGARQKMSGASEKLNEQVKKKEAPILKINDGVVCKHGHSVSSAEVKHSQESFGDSVKNEGFEKSKACVSKRTCQTHLNTIEREGSQEKNHHIVVKQVVSSRYQAPSCRNNRIGADFKTQGSNYKDRPKDRSLSVSPERSDLRRKKRNLQRANPSISYNPYSDLRNQGDPESQNFFAKRKEILTEKTRRKTKEEVLLNGSFDILNRQKDIIKDIDSKLNMHKNSKNPKDLFLILPDCYVSYSKLQEKAEGKWAGKQWVLENIQKQGRQEQKIRFDLFKHPKFNYKRLKIKK